MCKLEDIIPHDMKIRLLKIDTEGYELFVLSGAKKILKDIEIIYFESFEKHFRNYNYSTADLIKFLKENNFLIYKIDKNELVLINGDNYISHYYENLIALNNKYNLMKIIWD